MIRTQMPARLISDNQNRELPQMHFNFRTSTFSKPGVAIMAFLAGLAFNSSAVAQDSSAPDASKNWKVVCVAGGRGEQLVCTMEQQIIVRETGQRLARLTIKKTNAGEGFASILLQVPLGLSIVDNLVLQVDQAAPLTIPIQTCDAAGCYGGHIIDNKLLSGLRAGNQLVLSFFDLQKQKMSATFTLAGFTSAYSKIE